MHPDRRILVLGGGPAGVAAARMGAQAILIDSGRLGGVSTNSGALPARVLAHAARLKRDSGQLGVYGLRATEAGLDWPAALQRLSNVASPASCRWRMTLVSTLMAKQFAAHGIRIHSSIETRHRL